MPISSGLSQAANGDPADIPPDAKQAVQDYLARLDDAAFGAASEVTPKFVSPSDPAAQWTGAHRGPAFFAYATNYLIDTDNAVIVDVEATRAIRLAEVGAAQTMIERVMGRFGLQPSSQIPVVRQAYRYFHSTSAQAGDDRRAIGLDCEHESRLRK